MNSFLQLFLVTNVYILSSTAQITSEEKKYEPKTFEGYFILVRDSIPKTDSDVTSPTLSFNTFYVKSIDNNMLECLQQINRPKHDSVVFISGAHSNIASPQEHKEYVNWLIKNDYFIKADKGYPLFDIKKMPKDLLNSKRRFVAVYKGKCIVVGPFYPNNKLQLENQNLYMYLPIDGNATQYLYSIVF